ncbi:MAG TPA: type I methionyl aminopeptidase [Flavobacteriales bacterium]|nr:type I methionyl aminopeptidase [Flavobacteriales bacterium]
MAVELKNAGQIEIMRQSARLVSKTLGLMAEMIEPGVTPLQLDKRAEEFIRDNKGEPAFKGYGPKNNPFPNTLCISINEVVVHGIPGNTPLKEGDIVTVDCGVKRDGYFGDHAYTFAVGEITEEKKRLLQVTLECLYKGINEVVKGKRMGDLSQAIQDHAEKNGYGVVRELIGHGLGRHLHEPPEVPNFGKRGRGPSFVDGMTIAIEPMINMGTQKVKWLSDGWTVVTADGKPSAHFEHDVAVIDGKGIILSTFDYVEEALKKKGMPVLQVQ